MESNLRRHRAGCEFVEPMKLVPPVLLNARNNNQMHVIGFAIPLYVYDHFRKNMFGFFLSKEACTSP